MPSLDKDNPLKPIHDKVSRIRDRLEYVISFVLNASNAVLEGLRKFLKNIKANLGAIQEKIGKSVANMLIKQGEALLSLMGDLRKSATEAKKLALKVLSAIEKAAKEPQKIFKAVKAKVARLASVFRNVVSFIKTLASLIKPIAFALALIDTFKMVLKLMLKWITDVSGIAKGVKQVESSVKKAVKMLGAELKNVTKLVKEANALKPA